MRKLLYFLVVCLIAFASYGAAPAVIGTAGGVEGGGDAGPFTFSDSDGGNNWSTSITATVDVTAGDLIVVIGGTRAGINITGFTDSQGDNDSQFSTNLRSQIEYSTEPFMRSSWAIATNTRSGLVITMTDDDGTNRRYIVVFVFSPASGETVSFDGEGTKSASEASPWETSEITTTGTDEACVGVFINISGRTYTNEEIPSTVAADGVVLDDDYIVGFYSIKSATVSGCEAEVDVNNSAAHVATLLCFKSE